MKTEKTQQEAIELLKEIESFLNIDLQNERPYFLKTQPLLLIKIKSFLLKNDNEAEIYSDCIKFISKVNDEEHSEDKEYECPMNNLIDRLTTMYPLVSSKLDTNFDFGEKVPNIFQQYQAAFKKHGITIDTWSGKNDTFYYVLEHKDGLAYSSEKESNYEFEQTAQMACIEKAFEVCNDKHFECLPISENTKNELVDSIDLLDKFEDWHVEREYEHLKAGTEFKPEEVFEYFKPYIKINCK